MKKLTIHILAALLIATATTSCNKLIEIGTPQDQLVTASVFGDTVSVEAAVRNIYAKLADGFPGTDPGTATTLFDALSADEGYHYTYTFYDDFKNNALTPTTYYPGGYWSMWYSLIYITNSLILGDSTSATLPAAYKTRTIAEAKFMRALSHFYLVNTFGAVPLVLTTDVSVTNVQGRESVEKVYDQIEKDLTDAKAGLPKDLSYYGGNKTRATSWTASALLARVYLYRGKWAQAVAEATNVIGNPGLFSLNPDPAKVFQANNQEGILQLIYPFTSSWTASTMGTNSFSVTPGFVLSDSLAAAFETGDVRKTVWTGIKAYGGKNYPIYAKYKYVGGTNPVEYAQVLRMSEQYLIRAEANTQLNKYSDAAADLNVVRTRAGLPNTTASDKPSLVAAIEHENRIEYFCELGHRWLDLKRWPGINNPATTRVNEVLSVAKPTTWQPTDALWPIPQQDINVNQNLTQNPGYN